MDPGTANLAELRETGLTHLRGVFAGSALEALRDAAEACFRAIESGQAASQVEGYRFNPFSTSVVVSALRDFGYPGELTAPLSAPGVGKLLREAMGCEVRSNLDQSWVRKRFAPCLAPHRYQPNTWHQDGGLGVRFGPAPEPAPPMTPLVTCWLPLNPCAGDCPALEFVRRRLNTLLHYTELNDADLRLRFPVQEFQAPCLEFGDGLIFLNGTLHRTWVRPDMRANRLSVEYRFFCAPANAPAPGSASASDAAIGNLQDTGKEWV